VYNRTQFLEAALQSVIDQTVDDWEVVIVDDGSEAQCAERISRLAAVDRRIRVVTQKNLGAGRARQHGFEVSVGELIQFLDSDDILLPNKFEVQIKALKEQPRCGIAYGVTRLIDSDGRVLKEPYKWTAEVQRQLFPKLLVDRWWNTQTPLYRREVCEEAGAWSDMSISEDWEFEARIAGAEVELVHVPDVVCATRKHDGDRLTGQTENVGELEARVRLLEALSSNAEKARLPKNSGEMRHFSRWAFFTSRRCGHHGLDELAKRSFAVAAQSVVKLPKDFQVFKLATQLIGWQAASRLAGVAEKLRGRNRKTGAGTMELSWTSMS